MQEAEQLLEFEDPYLLRNSPIRQARVLGTHEQYTVSRDRRRASQGIAFQGSPEGGRKGWRHRRKQPSMTFQAYRHGKADSVPGACQGGQMPGPASAGAPKHRQRAPVKRPAFAPATEVCSQVEKAAHPNPSSVPTQTPAATGRRD